MAKGVMKGGRPSGKKGRPGKLDKRRRRGAGRGVAGATRGRPPAASKARDRRRQARTASGRGGAPRRGGAANVRCKQAALSTAALARLFGVRPGQSRFGIGAVAAVVEANGRYRAGTVSALGAFHADPDRHAEYGFARLSNDRALAAVLSGLSHPSRLSILRALLVGMSSYAELCAATRQRSGPLYHHVRALILAGLVRIRRRDTYELTPLGRSVFLLAVTMGPLLARRWGPRA